jgi:hypothetical protein
MERKWDAISSAEDKSLTEKIQKLLRTVAKVGHSRDLRVQEITLQAMLEHLYEPGEVPALLASSSTGTSQKRVAELDLDPICGLTIVTDATDNSTINSANADAATSKASLPVFRPLIAGAVRKKASVTLVRATEVSALGPLLQPIRLLVDVAQAAGSSTAEQGESAVQRMAHRLQALEPAILSLEHGFILKGLVVESPTCARLVLWVRNPLGVWECWATPRTVDKAEFLSCVTLAVLRSGPELVDDLLKIDRKWEGVIFSRRNTQKRERRRFEKASVVPQSALDAAEEQDRREGWKPPLLKVTDWRHARYGFLTEGDYVLDDN